MALTVHARTRDQVHAGPVDLDALAQACAAVAIPVIGNGGIRSPDDAAAMMSHTGCTRVAVGQAARGNPWLFRELLGKDGPPSLEERVDTCRRHLDLYVAWAGERRAVVEMRKHTAWYLKGFPGAGAMRARLNRTEEIIGYHTLLDEVRELVARG
jgi:tRNA-dihydrouridine synthase